MTNINLTNIKKIVIYSVTSMDGFTARMDGDIDWMQQFTRNQPDPRLREFSAGVGAVVMSSHYYNTLQSYDIRWPYGEIPCYLVSPSLMFSDTPEYANVERIWMEKTDKRNAWFDDLNRLRETGVGDIWVAGDKEILSVLMDNNMIDEIHRVVLPFTLGHGQPWFKPFTAENSWKVEDSEVYPNDILYTHYTKLNTSPANGVA